MSALQAYFYISPSRNPHETLALEEALLEAAPKDAVTLYLYQHASSVIIGRNQNAWKECRHAQLQEEGGILARRISGGGAVYHDEGNLNFSFIVPRSAYDVKRQLGVLLEAVRSFGIDAQFTGRNDLEAKGRKFSGNAFCVRKHAAFHHGTLLLDTDAERMTRYLSPPEHKMQAKGVASVRSRVINLRELAEDAEPGEMAARVRRAFEAEYGSARPLFVPEEVQRRTAELAARNADWEWTHGKSPSSDVSVEDRFFWGSAELAFSLENGRIAAVRIFSDAMREDVIRLLEGALRGAALSSKPLSDAALAAVSDTDEEARTMARDIASLFAESMR